MDSATQAQILITLVGIIGSCIGAYIGVRVALAHINGRLDVHEDKIAENTERINRLERPYFK